MKIALIGYGKMGHMIEEIALQRGHEIVCKIDVNNPEDIDSPEFCSADVAIEFTNPTAAYGNYLKAFSHNVKVVSGSTGWMKDHKEDVEKLCADGKQTLFWASNFSIGVAIFSAVNRYLAKIMNGFPQYSVCMQETHHVHKLDAPSGTAITLAEEIIDNIDRKKDWKRGVTYWTEDGHHDEGDANITDEDLVINCVRDGEVPGDFARLRQTVECFLDFVLACVGQGAAYLIHAARLREQRQQPAVKRIFLHGFPSDLS